LLHTTLLTPENLVKLAEDEVEVWRKAIATVPKLTAPEPATGDQKAEAEETE
jgi:hypothetical protein